MSLVCREKRLPSGKGPSFWICLFPSFFGILWLVPVSPLLSVNLMASLFRKAWLIQVCSSWARMHRCRCCVLHNASHCGFIHWSCHYSNSTMMIFVILFSSSIVPQRKLTSLFFPFIADFQQERFVPHVWSLFVVFICFFSPFRYSWVWLGSVCVHRCLQRTTSPVSSLIAQGHGWGGILLMGGNSTISQRPELWSAHLVWAQASLSVLPQVPRMQSICRKTQLGSSAEDKMFGNETYCRILEVNTQELWYFTAITDYVRFLLFLLFSRLCQQKSNENWFYVPSSFPPWNQKWKGKTCNSQNVHQIKKERNFIS